MQTAIEIAHRFSLTLTCDVVLAYWRKNDELRMFPTLTKLAQLHLSSSAASVPVECMFTTAGLVLMASGQTSQPKNFVVFVLFVTIIQAAFLTVALILIRLRER